MKTEHLSVTGMTCDGCVGTLLQALKAVAGVEAVNVSLADGDATVQFDERRTTRAHLEAVVAGAGYGLAHEA